MGMQRKGRPERGIELRSEVGPAYSTMEAPEGTARAEGVEGRGWREGILLEGATGRTQSRIPLLPHLQRVHDAARHDKRARFTALLHHVDVAALTRAFRRLKRSASAGIDGITVEVYEQQLESNLQSLGTQIHTGRYRPSPVRRVMIPKAGGGQRPLGILALEDKVVQGAIAEVLNAIYEADFLGFSYGFRPRRNPHQALTALQTAVMTQYVNWVLDADIRKFFDSVDHGWLMRMLAHRIADPRVLRLVTQWLEAGVMEQGVWHETTVGTPQGAGISPLLANIYLHYVLDLWVQRWRRRKARGRVSIVRYADDFVMGFQTERDARQLRVDLQERLQQFGLQLHEEKTRVIEFGRLPALAHKQRGERRLGTFAFLGFTHYCGWTRDGRFVMKRKTQRQRVTGKLQALNEEAKRRRHDPVREQHQWLCQVLRGHYAYFGLPSNFRALQAFSYHVRRIWFRALYRRSQRRLTWEAFVALLDRFPLPAPRITHPRAS
jgi:RNA-directed DNA polymerase